LEDLFNTGDIYVPLLAREAYFLQIHAPQQYPMIDFPLFLGDMPENGKRL
jgi:hypothetical protein